MSLKKHEICKNEGHAASIITASEACRSGPRHKPLPSKKCIILGFPLLLFALVALTPLFMLLVSLVDLKLSVSPWEWLLKKHILSLILKSLIVSFTAVGVTLAVGLPLGLVLGARENPFSTGTSLLFFLPLAVPPYLTASCWMTLLGRGGLFPGLAHRWLGVDPAAQWLWGGWGAGVMLGFSYFPILTYLVISGLRAMDPNHEEAGMFALSERKILCHITLPLIFPHLGTGMLLIFLLSLTHYAVPALMGYRTLTVKIYTHFSVFQDSAGAVLLSTPLLMIAALTVLCLNGIMKRRAFFSIRRREGRGSVLDLFHSPGMKFMGYAPALVVTLTPVVYFIMDTGAWVNLRMAFSQSKGSMLASFVLALSSSLLMSLAAFFIGYAAERNRWLKKGAGRAILFFPFALPSVLLAIGIIHVWNRSGLLWAYQSVAVLGILWACKYLPLAQRVMADHMRQLPRDMEEIAFVCRLSWIQSMLRIVWPMTLPGFLVTWAVTYIFCLAELGGTLLVIPPGADTMPVRLYNLMHYGASGMVSALGLFLVLMAVIPLFAILLFGRWTRQRNRPV